MDASMEIEEYTSPDDWSSEVELSQLCRICASANEYLIPIFHGEGLEHELENKISQHLPIKVSEEDKLPIHLCYQCASTLIAWNDLVVTCIESEEKFKTVANSPSSTNYVQFTKDDIRQEEEVETQLVNSKQLADVDPEGTIIFQNEPNCENNPDETPNIVIEEVTSMDSQTLEDEVSSNSRCVAQFNTYHQTQTALRTLEWPTGGCVFCIVCGEKKQNHTMLIEHLKVEHTVRCSHCCANFANQDQLSVHLMRHNRMRQIKNYLCKKVACNSAVSNEVSSKCPIQCEICFSTFSRRFDLKRHKLKHHSIEISNEKENSNVFFKCFDGGFVNFEDKNIQGITSNIRNENVVSDIEDLVSLDDDSVNSEDIKRHLDVNKSSELGYYCSLCDLTIKTNQDFFVHQQKEHKVKPKRKVLKLEEFSNEHFSCSLCSNVYSRYAYLQKHICKKHDGVKIARRCVDFVDDMDVKIINEAKLDIGGTIVYRCSFCSKNVRTRRGFVRHIRVHTGERPFTCHVCGKQYRSNADLTRHLRCVHEGVKNYRCTICDRVFASKSTRNDHMRTHTGEKPYICDICGKSFPTPNSIYVHRRVHTDFFPHTCATCNKKFRRKQQLTNHYRTHTGEKPFACDVCGKCFSTKDEVSRHRLTHSSDKPHVCTVCGVCFGQKRYLKNHMKSIHMTYNAPVM